MLHRDGRWEFKVLSSNYRYFYISFLLQNIIGMRLYKVMMILVQCTYRYLDYQCIYLSVTAHFDAATVAGYHIIGMYL